MYDAWGTEKRLVIEGEEYVVYLVPDVDTGGWYVDCPEVPTAAGRGMTQVEALMDMRESLKEELGVG